MSEGIIDHIKKFPQKDLEGTIRNTVSRYLTYVENNNVKCGHNIIIQGVPCPNIDAKRYEQKEVEQLIELIKKFNFEYKNSSKAQGLRFMNVQELTDRGNGFSNALWHIDDIHLSPNGFLEAWHKHII